MRDFSWKYFMMTGDVDAYMLYKEMDSNAPSGSEQGEEEQVNFEEQVEPLM